MDKKELAKASNKTLVSVDEMDSMVNSEETGIEVGNTMYPKRIKIFQSDKQYKFFEDQRSVGPDDYGKFIILQGKDVKLKAKDLMTSVEGTLMRSQFGYYVYKLDQNGQVPKNPELIGSGVGIIKNDEREEWMRQNPGYGYKNIIKVALCLVGGNEAIELMAAGDNPFAIIDLKGMNYGSWFPVGGLMDQAIKEDGSYKNKKGEPVKSARGVIAPVFKLKLTTSNETSPTSGQEYIKINFEVKVNKPEFVKEFTDIAEKWKSMDLFGNWSRNTDHSTSEERPIRESVSDEEIINPDDLPF